MGWQKGPCTFALLLGESTMMWLYSTDCCCRCCHDHLIDNVNKNVESMGRSSYYSRWLSYSIAKKCFYGCDAHNVDQLHVQWREEGMVSKLDSISPQLITDLTVAGLVPTWKTRLYLKIISGYWWYDWKQTMNLIVKFFISY